MESQTVVARTLSPEDPNKMMSFGVISTDNSLSVSNFATASETIGNPLLVDDLVTQMNLRVERISNSIMNQMDGMGKQLDELESRIDALAAHAKRHQQMLVESSRKKSDDIHVHSSSSPAGTRNAFVRNRSPKRIITLTPSRSPLRSPKSGRAPTPTSSTSASTESSSSSCLSPKNTNGRTRSPRRGIFFGSKAGPCEV